MEALLAEMLKAIKTSRTTPDQIDLPTFHPDSDDAKTWIGQIGEIKNEFGWTDLQVLVRVGRFLSGESKGWFDSWLLNEASVCNSSEFNTYSAYVHKKLALLKNLRANWNTADLIELVGYGIRDAKVQEAVYLRNFESISDLISYLSSLVKSAVDDVRTKRPAELSTSPIPTKNARGRFERSETVTKSKLSCFKCGRLGHKQNVCQDRRSSINRNFNTNVGNSSKIKSRRLITKMQFLF
jgi:hypothetical protein